MKIISQNIVNYGFDIPSDTIFRVNLAWCSSIEELKKILELHTSHKIFLDLPIKRIKPPNNRYTLDDLIPLFSEYAQISYLAISNVDSEQDLEEFLEKVPDRIVLVPKIESPTAVDNISEIVNKISNKEKIVMLDHDDLFTNIKKKNGNSEDFTKYIQTLKNFCNEKQVTLLRTVGVIFSDDEKRVSEYVK
tara:strand:+ start:23892 stop:24464 length:573 start_codon:yes stop_codon:yes gene_type:complete